MSDKTIQVSPAKRFFVEMLTRDIDLDDAIMDLVDNSVDGLLRMTKNDKSKFPNYKIRLEINDSFFKIMDNCGGIPLDIAENVAFKMGRPYGDERDKDIPTIGMYGIGMKRAMFKMGTDIHVVSRHENDCFEVRIDDRWLHDDNDWELALNDCTEPLEDWNTIITVSHLKDGIRTLFSKESDFTQRLRDKIGIHYTKMIHDGLHIEVVHHDSDPIVVPSKEISFLVQEDALKSKKGILPYIYREESDDLKITLICGIVGEPPGDEDELERTRQRIEAGWTIMCNDRVVVYADTGRLTGWGDGLPKFHYQFNNLVGIVMFESNDADKLPVTTTKRGIDASSDVFLRIRNKMISAMKHFVSYTNKWKNDREVEKREILSKTNALSLEDLVAKLDDFEFNENNNGKLYVPNLPIKPNDKSIKTRVMRFAREKKDIEKVAKCYFEWEDFDIKEASKVAEECFDEILSRIEDDC